MAEIIDIGKTEVSLEELLSIIRQGEQVILLEDNRPLARIVPLDPNKRIAGLHPRIWTRDDFDDPLPDEFWFGEG